MENNIEKIKSKRVNLFLDRREEKVLLALLKKYGGSAASLFKSMLKDKFDKSFPAYAAKVKGGKNPMLIDLTPEQLCEQAGGEVNSMDRTCKLSPDITGQAVTYYIPLGDPNDMLRRINELRGGGNKPPIEV